MTVCRLPSWEPFSKQIKAKPTKNYISCVLSYKQNEKSNRIKKYSQIMTYFFLYFVFFSYFLDSRFAKVLDKLILVELQKIPKKI